MGRTVKALNSRLCRNPDRVAKFACNCTSWAREVALEEGARDFVRAYEDDDDPTETEHGLEEEKIEEIGTV